MLQNHLDFPDRLLVGRDDKYTPTLDDVNG
jgi:hypothetical protein